jgi:hypothetical protein
MDENQIQYLPFHAINEFMLDEYRQQVITAVLRGVEKLPNERRGRINGLVRKYVSLPGFRNSALAPLALRVKGSITAFERRPDFAAQVLQAWSDLHPELRAQLHGLLEARNWEKLLPADADRSKLPGFMTEWPKTETYDVLDQAYADMFPDSKAEAYDVRLMAVWVANRLPYELFEDEEGEEEEEPAEK